MRTFRYWALATVLASVALAQAGKKPAGGHLGERRFQHALGPWIETTDALDPDSAINSIFYSKT